MTDGHSRPVPRPSKRSTHWTSFVVGAATGRAVRGLHEEGHPEHRVRVEHSRHTLLVHVSDEDGKGWTVLAIDRQTREWAVAQRPQQRLAVEAAYRALYRS